MSLGPAQWFKIGVSHFVPTAVTPFPGGCSFRVLFRGEKQFVAFGCYDGPNAYAGEAKTRVKAALDRYGGDPLAFDCTPAERIDLAMPSRTCPRCFAPFHLEEA